LHSFCGLPPRTIKQAIVLHVVFESGMQFLSNRARRPIFSGALDAGEEEIERRRVRLEDPDGIPVELLSGTD
jgi:hypothetical protein